MNYRVLTFIGFATAASATLFLGQGCANDEPDDSVTVLSAAGPVGGLAGGSSGSAGSAGASGTAGASGSSGAAGTAGNGGTAGSAGSSGGSNASVRLANMSLGGEEIDFCVKASSAADYSGATKLLAMSPGKLTYTQVSGMVDAAGAGATFDAKVINAADADCSGTALAEVTGVASSANGVLIAYMGGNGVNPSAAAFPQSAPKAANFLLRVIHAMPGKPDQDVGLVNMNTGKFIPGAGIVFAGIKYGETSKATATPSMAFPIDTQGYVEAVDLGLNRVGSADTGQDPFLQTSATLGPANAANTTFLVGKGDMAQPYAFVICDEAMVSGGLTTCETKTM